jgi:hypothetical protein
MEIHGEVAVGGIGIGGATHVPITNPRTIAEQMAQKQAVGDFGETLMITPTRGSLLHRRAVIVAAGSLE